MAIILGIESSCDDTSASIVKDGNVLSNIVCSQAIHQKYGGVVPELASRAHEKNIIPTISEALKSASVSLSEINAISFTQGPGLLGSLLVGNCFAKGIAMAQKIPLISVNHIEAHINAHFIEDVKPTFPFLCLTVSGGHTQIICVEGFGKYKLLGETLDDAIGEAFDKSAKLLGLPYPGGPLLDKMAQLGNFKKYEFPIPEIKNYDFSFSGIKTSILNFLQNNTRNNPDFIAQNLNDICASIQYTLIKIVMRKLKKASQEFNIKTIAIAGGVAANSELRSKIQFEVQLSNWEVFIPKFEYCTDNAAMIAITGYYKFLNNDFADLSSVPNPRLEMKVIK